AAEVEARHEQLADVLLARDLAAEVVVEILDAARQRRIRVALEPVAAAHRVHHGGEAVLLRVLEEGGAVEIARVGAFDGLAIALLPVTDEIGVKHAGPADATLQEGEVEIREAAREAPEEESLAHRVARGGEVPDVVVAEVRRRVAQENGARPVVEAGRDLELAALLPHGIVVVVAVDADHVVPLDEA